MCAQQTAASAPGPTGEWPLVGRDAELAEIAQARAGGLPAIVVAGGAGVGKSRLARVAAAAAEEGGAHVARVHATRSAATVPLGAFAGIVPEAARADDLLGLLRGALAALREQAGGRPLVIAVDDAQLLDPPSAALVLHLVESGAGFVVATVRSGEPCPDAIVSLWKDGGARRLELAPFGAAQTAAAVEAVLGGPVEQGALHWLHERSGGNALYLRELVTGALDAGALADVRGLWRLAADRPAVSATLAELVGARMAALGDDERRLLELLAIGEPLRAPELAALAGEPALLAVEARGLVAAGAGDEVRLSHPLYGETLQAGIGPLRARAARRELAAAVQARPALGPDEALRVARWLLDAGEPLPPALLLDAAAAATRSGDPALGAELAALARDGGAGFEAALALAGALAAAERLEEAAEALAAAEGDAPGEEEAFAYLEQRIAVLYWRLRRRDELLALLERAGGWWPGESWRRRLAPLRIYSTAASTDGYGSGEETAALLADPSTDPELRRQLEPIRIAHLFYFGRSEEALALARRIKPAIPLPGPSEELAQILWSTTAYETGRDWERLDGELAADFATAVRAGDYVAAGFTAVGIGALRLAAGRLPDAHRWLAEAELQLERRDSIGVLAITRAFQVVAHAADGDEAAAAAALERTRAVLIDGQPMPNQVPYLARAEAWELAVRGDRPRAQERLLEVAGELGAMPFYAGLLTHDALRLGAPARRVAPALALLHERTDAPLAAAWAAHAAAHADRDGAGLLAAAGAFETIGALRCAAEASADAATAFHEAGRADSARRAAARRSELHGRGEGGTPPPVDGLDGPAIALTPRERQLVELAARGLTNAEIADRLVLSVRTVESHIYRAMQKLGVSDRRELG